MRGRIVLATYNEAGSIRAVLAEIDEAVMVLARAGIELDVLLVDDSSPDQTADVAKETAEMLGLHLEVLSGQKAGLGRALLRGFRHAMSHDPPDFFVTLDADGQHDARQMPDLVRAFLARGSGITIGSRWTRGGSSPGTPALRAVLSRTGNFLARRITGLSGVRDATTSFRVIKADVTTLFSPEQLRVDGYGFFSAFVAMTQAHGYSIDEVPITFRPRYSGVSKLTARELFDFFVNLFKVRKNVRSIRREVRRDQTAWAARSPMFQAQAPTSGPDFGGERELEHLASADHFFQWIASEFAPSLGANVLEVGAGIGTVATRLAVVSPQSTVLAIEPAGNLFTRLRRVVLEQPRITARNLTSQELLAERTSSGPSAATPFSAVVYVNVLEHIEDDIGELRTARDLLSDDGALCVFVPAVPSMYGTLDFRTGHYRRYSRSSLARLVDQAGYDIERLVYFDVASLVPYWLMYRVLRVQKLGGRSSALFDRVLVPISRRIQRIWPNPPIGKNLLLIARPRRPER